MTQQPTIAFCYDLKSDYIAQGYSVEDCAELDESDTIDAITNTLKELGHNVVPIGNTRALVKHLATDPTPKWDMVFNIAEGLHGVAREAQVPALLEAYKIPCTFSDAATLCLCLDKARTKICVRHYGVPTAPFAIVHNSVDTPKSPNRGSIAVAQSQDAALLTYPLFAKPVAEGSSKGVFSFSKVHNKEELDSVIDKYCELFPDQDILIEKFLPGRELTVGILGTGIKARAIGTLESKLISEGNTFLSYAIKNAHDWENHITEHTVDTSDPVVAQAATIALQAYRVLGCRDAGRIDVRCGDDGNAYFLEVNPLAGMRPNWSQLPHIAKDAGISYKELIREIVDSAAQRITTRK